MYKFLPVLILISFQSFAQINCETISKATSVAAENFTSCQHFRYYTAGGLKAYDADFTLVNGESGFVYRDTIENEVYFYQEISAYSWDYNAIYKQIEQCLLSQQDHWTKVDAAQQNGVLFSAEKSGVEIQILKTDIVLIKIERDPSKNISVLSPSFCEDLKKLAAACNNDFEGLKIGEGETSILGTSYKSAIKLNGRNLSGGSITLSTDIFDKSKKANSYTETISETDMAFNDLINAVENCLSDEWIKTTHPYSKGFIYTRNDVSVTITSKKIFESDSYETHIVSVSSAL